VPGQRWSNLATFAGNALFLARNQDNFGFRGISSYSSSISSSFIAWRWSNIIIIINMKLKHQHQQHEDGTTSSKTRSWNNIIINMWQ
jgi:hypothetical protein